MKVLHIVSSISQTNGAMNVIMNYYRELVKHNIIFDFLFFRKTEIDYSAEIQKLNGNVFYCGGSGSLNTIIKMHSFIHSNCCKYDAIENHELYLTRFINKQNCILILHSHTVQYSQRKLASFRNRILCYRIDAIADFLTSCSLESAKFFWPEAIEKNKFQIMHNAIPFDKCKFSENMRKMYRERFSLESDKIVLGYVARFDDGKNQEYLVEILNELCKQSEKYVLMLVGDGKNFQKVKRTVDEFHLNSKVIFTGTVPGAEVKNYLSSMDIFLFPSTNEGLGQAVIEAQGNGLPCIVSTGIPLEAKISREFQFVMLMKEDGTPNYEEWIKNIYSMNLNRQNINFFNSGYEIGNEAEKIAEWYKSIIG